MQGLLCKLKRGRGKAPLWVPGKGLLTLQSPGEIPLSRGEPVGLGTALRGDSCLSPEGLGDDIPVWETHPCAGWMMWGRDLGEPRGFCG